MYKLTLRLGFFPVFAFFIVFGCAASARAQASVVTISGRVIDQSTGQGISGMAVVCQGNQTGTRVAVTDAQGDYTLPFGANTNIKLRAYKSGYIFNPVASEIFSFGGGPVTGSLARNFTGTFFPIPILLIVQPPVLLTEDGSLNALALDAVLHTRDPFPLVNDNYPGTDKRTRLVLFLADLDLSNGESLSVITAQAQDAQQRTYTLPVEDLRNVPDVPWMSQLTVCLPGELAGMTDITLSVSARGQTSNAARLRLK